MHARLGPFVVKNSASEQDLEFAAVAANNHDNLVEALEAIAACRVERSTAWAEEHEPWPDDHKLVGYDGWWLTAGMVRKARATLAAVREGQPK
jgi:hypothetical protein